jgi:MoxR-like ATPase
VVYIDRGDNSAQLKLTADAARTLRLKEGDDYWFTLAQLNRAELMKAYAFAYPGGGKITGHTTEKLRQAIADGKPIEPPPFELTTSTAQPLPTPAPDTKPAEVKPSNGAEQLGLLVEQLARDAAGTAVDEDAVRAIVATEVEQLSTTVLDLLADLRPHVTTVTVDGGEPIEVAGRQHEMFPLVVTVLGRRKHVMLVGPAGTGKSTIGHNAANALGLHFESMSVGPTTPESRLFGYKDANGVYHSTGFRRCFEDGGVFLLDEIDNGHPGILAGLNQALANGTCGFPDGMVKRHDDFVVIATANTWGTGATAQHVGRNAIDAATLDRFVKVEIPIDQGLEADLVKARCPERADELLRLVNVYRRNIEANGLRVMVSPRATIDAADLLSAGLTMQQVHDVRLLSGIPAEQRTKVQGS